MAKDGRLVGLVAWREMYRSASGWRSRLRHFRCWVIASVPPTAPEQAAPDHPGGGLGTLWLGRGLCGFVRPQADKIMPISPLTRWRTAGCR